MLDGHVIVLLNDIEEFLQISLYIANPELTNHRFDI